MNAVPSPLFTKRSLTATGVLILLLFVSNLAAQEPASLAADPLAGAEIQELVIEILDQESNLSSSYPELLYSWLFESLEEYWYQVPAYAESSDSVDVGSIGLIIYPSTARWITSRENPPMCSNQNKICAEWALPNDDPNVRTTCCFTQAELDAAESFYDCAYPIRPQI